MSTLTRIASFALISASSLSLAVESSSALSISLNTGTANYSISGAANVGSGLNLTTPNGAYFANDADSRWIGPILSASNSAPGGNYVYSTVFSLAGLDPTTATISPIKVASDNLFTSLTLNGNLILVPIATSNFTGFTSYNIIPATFVSFLIPSNNTVAFTINNAGGPTGFRAEFSVDATPVPFEFEPTSGLLLIGGYFATKRFLRNKKA